LRKSKFALFRGGIALYTDKPFLPYSAGVLTEKWGKGQKFKKRKIFSKPRLKASTFPVSPVLPLALWKMPN